MSADICYNTVVYLSYNSHMSAVVFILRVATEDNTHLSEHSFIVYQLTLTLYANPSQIQFCPLTFGEWVRVSVCVRVRHLFIYTVFVLLFFGFSMNSWTTLLLLHIRVIRAQ